MKRKKVSENLRISRNANAILKEVAPAISESKDFLRRLKKTKCITEEDGRMLMKKVLDRARKKRPSMTDADIAEAREVMTIIAVQGLAPYDGVKAAKGAILHEVRGRSYFKPKGLITHVVSKYRLVEDCVHEAAWDLLDSKKLRLTPGVRLTRHDN